MLKNYFKTAWRNIVRHKLFTLINVAGLAIGISAALVVYLIVHYDLSFDKFERDNSRIYRVVMDMQYSGNKFHSSGVQAPLAEVVKNEVTGLTDVAAFHVFDGDAKVTLPANGDKTLKKQNDIIFADGSYFNVINYQWLAGSATNALSQPYQLVLTEQRAKEYFPTLELTDIIGKQVIYNDSVKTTVTGIVKQISQSTDFVFHDVISLATISHSGLKDEYIWGNWGTTSNSSQLYVKLAEGSMVNQIENLLVGIEKKYDKKPAGTKNISTYKLQPLSDIHFNYDYGTYGDYSEHMAHKPTLYGLLAVGGFLLLLGCINFVNLSTAQAAQRAKEIGIRKTMGSSKGQLMFQFLSETFLITVISTILSVILAPVLLKMFADFIPPGLHFNITEQPDVVLFLAALAITVSALAGFYPAWILSGYNPVAVLKNQAFADSRQTRKTWIRRSLTVFQFLVAQIFIMGTFMVAKQIHFTLNQNMGFKKDAIMYFKTPFGDNVSNRTVLMNKLNAIPEIAMTSLGNSAPAESGSWTGPAKYIDGKKELTTIMQLKQGDANYLKLYHIKLVAGRSIMPTEPQAAIVNETYAHMMGFKNAGDMIGKFIERDNEHRPVVGVVADFHQESFRQPIKPMLFSSRDQYSRTFHIALKAQNTDGTNWTSAIAKIEAAYKQIYPDGDFQYTFLDKKIDSFYKSEQNVSALLTWATGLAIFISCLGLLGLVIYTTNLRTKEIGIRKVLGASVAHIVSILSVDFVQLVLISFVIAAPIAWWGMNKWLQNYSYRTSINWWIFALSGLLMLGVALITLSFQTIRAAIANPVKSLKNE